MTATAKKTSRSISHHHPLPDFAASEAALRRQLLTDAHREIWEANFGAAEYRALKSLARRAAAATRRGPRVYILPGIMGSKLGVRGEAGPLVWIDPEEIQRGRLLELALPAGERFRAVGVMVLTYLKLKLTLEIAGFDVVFHPYDWRRGIDALGRELHARLARERARSVMLVAHSMGGLVARVALGLEGGARGRIERLIMLATPNYGSFAPVLALRGVYPVVRTVARLDPHHSPEMLARRVFSTFPGLHHMLPAPQRCAGPDLWDPASWPDGALGPRPSLLKGVRATRALLAPADRRCTLIAGIDQDTVTSLARRDGAFEYFVSRNGDGTVPLELARLEGARTYYVRENHGSLAANGEVCAAVVELLRTGATRRLPTRWRRKTGWRPLSEAALRQTDGGKLEWAALGPQAQRVLLQGLVVPMPTNSPRSAGAKR